MENIALHVRYVCLHATYQRQATVSCYELLIGLVLLPDQQSIALHM